MEGRFLMGLVAEGAGIWVNLLILLFGVVEIV